MSDDFERLIGEMDARTDEIAGATLERVSQRFPNWAAETAFGRERVEEFIRAAIREQLRDFRLGMLPDSCPPSVVVATRALARTGELETFANGYRSAEAALWQAWFSLVEDSSLAAPERRELLAKGSDFFFRYSELLGDFVTQIYVAEFSRLSGNGAQRRFTALKAFLDGDPAAPELLDVDLGRHHLGAIAWGTEAEAAVRELAGALERPSFSVTPLPGTRWAWISGTRPLGAPERLALSAFEPPPTPDWRSGRMNTASRAFGGPTARPSELAFWRRPPSPP